MSSFHMAAAALAAALSSAALASVPVTSAQHRPFGFAQNDSLSVSWERFDDLDGAMTLHEVSLQIAATIEASFSLTNLSDVPVDTDAHVMETLAVSMPELIASSAVIIDADIVLDCGAGLLLEPGETCDYGGVFTISASVDITRDDDATLAAFTGAGAIDTMLEGFGSIDYDGDLYEWTIQTHHVSGEMSLVYTFANAPEPCPADVSRDGMIDFDDLLRVLMGWGSCEECQEDVDGDGVVGGADLLQIMVHWGPC